MAVVAVVVAAVLAATVVVWWKRDDDTGPRAAWDPPAQTFLASPMRAQPVPGWRISVTDLGLPGRISTNDNPFNSQPFVGSLGDNGYFLGSSPAPVGTQWWLTAIDVQQGRAHQSALSTGPTRFSASAMTRIARSPG